MISSGAEQAGIDTPTMSVEDSYITKMMSNSMDLKKMIAFIGAFYWLSMTIIIVPAAIVATFFTIFIPAMYFSVPLYNWLDHKLCRMVNDHWVSASQNNGLNVIEYGEDISKISNKRVLLLPNHLGLADHFVIMNALYNKGNIAEKYLWVIFNIWKLTPLGAMWMIHGNFFINGGASQRTKLLEEFKQHLRKYYWRHDYGWIVVYPEGSRLFLLRESNARYAKKIGCKVFKHCALPRTGAVHAALQVAGKLDTKKFECYESGDPVEYIVDCTIGYYKGDVPELGSYLMGNFPLGVTTVGINYKIFPVKPEWSDENVLKDWLYKRYEEKDEMLEYYYEKGSFPDCETLPPRHVVFPFSRFIIVELFWILLFYFHYCIWLKPLFSVLRSMLSFFF